MKERSILLVEDADPTAELIPAAYREEGHLVRLAKTMQEGYELLEQANTDMIIMDRGLPDGDGLRLCLTLRKDSRFQRVPILMLTGKADPADRVLGLRYGADDYLAKPFDVDELIARVDAILRRTSPAAAYLAGRLEAGGIVLDLKGRRVTIKGDIIALTGREYELLRVLMEKAGTVLTREFLLGTVWKASEGTVGRKTVDVTVMNLRRKLGGKGAMIVAVRPDGYKMLPFEK
jgi:DNA-binding response OmpR family regulator